MACRKLRFFGEIVKGFADNLCDMGIFFFLPLGEKISFIEDNKKYIRRLRKSGIYAIGGSKLYSAVAPNSQPPTWV
jgi:hypothetical protein